MHSNSSGDKWKEILIGWNHIIQLTYLVNSRFSQIIQVCIGFQEEIELEFIFFLSFDENFLNCNI